MRLPGRENALGAPPERRRRNPDRTRATILSAATSEFAARGYDGASVNEIAFAAGVNKRMLYHYYDSKDGLYLACLEAAYRGLGEAMAALQLEARAPLAALEAFVTGMFDHVLAHPELVRLAAIENMAGGRNAVVSAMLPRLLEGALATLSEVLERGERDGVFQHVDPLQLWMTLVAIAWFPVANRHTVSIMLGSDPMASDALALRRRHIVDVAHAAVAVRPAAAKAGLLDA